MSSQKRRHWKAEEKLQMLEEARKTDSTVSEVCRRNGIGTGQFYAWEKHARQGALAALRNGKRGRKESNRIAERKEKLVQAVEMRQAYWQRKEVRDQGQTLT